MPIHRPYLLTALLAALSFTLALPAHAETDFDKTLQAVITDVGALMKEHKGDVKGKCGDSLKQLEQAKPAEDAENYDVYLSAMGELLFVNGDYAAAATYMRASSGGQVLDFGVWNKIVEAIYHSAGKKAARAEYELALSRVKGKAQRYTFETEVGGVLQRLDKAREQ